MALTKEAKQEIITKHGRSEADTGSPQVQIAMLTQRTCRSTTSRATAPSSRSSACAASSQEHGGWKFERIHQCPAKGMALDWLELPPSTSRVEDN